VKDDEMLVVWPSDELSRRLTSYALTLNPSADASARMRQAVLARSSSRIAAPPVAVPRRFEKRSFRAATALLAACLGIAAIAGVSAAADVGGPLYATRLWAETLTLPAEPDARIIADVSRLDDRVADVRRAAAGGNGDAARAALDAYGAVIDDLVSTAGTDASRDAVVTTALDQHLDVLTALQDRVPAAAATALQVAFDRASGAIDRLGAGGGNGRGGSGGQPGGNGNVDGNGNGNGNGIGPMASRGPSPSPTPDATRTDRPSPSHDDRGGGKPVRTPSPEATPAATSAPSATADPSPTANGDPGSQGGNDQGHGGDDQGSAASAALGRRSSSTVEPSPSPRP
jgi:hypothetical protein